MRDLRINLIAEEWVELLQAEDDNDIVEIADALGDIVYVIFGMALAYGIPLNDVVAEIHRSNMSKLPEDGTPITRADGKIQKGPNYSPPALEELLFAATA